MFCLFLQKELHMFVCLKKSRMQDEETMFRKMQEGDWKAFNTFFEQYSERLFHYAVGFVKRREEAEDIVQEAFIYLWTHRDKISYTGSVYAYLARTVKHACIDFKLHEEVKARYEREMAGQEETDEGTDGTEEDFEELYARLQEVMNALPAKCREVFVMGCVDGMSYKEIAEKLGVSVNTVKTQMKVAYKKVKGEFGDKNVRFTLLLFCHIGQTI